MSNIMLVVLLFSTVWFISKCDEERESRRESDRITCRPVCGAHPITGLYDGKCHCDTSREEHEVPKP